MAPLTTYQHAGLTFEVDDSDGDGEVVVLLHGFPQTRTSWHRVTPHLVEAGYRVLAPDQRGYSPGARPRRRRDYALGHLIGDVVALADAAEAERFHVVGHDWGGFVAWGLGAAHPDRVASLTSLSTPHPRAMAASLVRSDQMLRSWYMLAFQVPALPEKVLGGTDRMANELASSGLSPEQAEASVRLLRSGAARGAISWYRAIPFAGPSLVADVSVPTLYIYGAQDFALGRTAAELTGRRVRGPYRFEVLEDVGHWIPEHPEHVVPPLLAHLRAHPT